MPDGAGLVDLMDAAMSQIESVLAPEFEDLSIDAVFHSGRLNSPGTTPAIDIFPGVGRDTESRMFSDDQDGGGYLYTVRARLSSNDYDANQDTLYRLMDDQGDLSLAGAICADETLGGFAASLDCTDPSGEVVFTDPGGTFYGFQFTLRVLPSFS